MWPGPVLSEYTAMKFIYCSKKTQPTGFDVPLNFSFTIDIHRYLYLAPKGNCVIIAFQLLPYLSVSAAMCEVVMLLET